MAKSATVFMVIENDWEDWYILGTYTTHEVAQQHLDQIVRERGDHQSRPEYEIKTVEVRDQFDGDLEWGNEWIN